MSRGIFYCCLFIVLSASNVTFAGDFDIGEITVAPSPAESKFLEFKQTEKVLDFDVAKDGPEAAILIQNQSGGGKVLFWDPSSSESPGEWQVPKGFAPQGFAPRALAWHPAAKSFFLAGKQGNEHVIMRVDKSAGGWAAKPVYRNHQEIRRLVPAPRPYAIKIDYSGNEPKITKAYRIFFGLKNQDGTYSIKSVTEDGTREYQVIGNKKGFTTFKDADEQPSRLEATSTGSGQTHSALPLGFHPAGDILLWEDGNRNFQYALYGRDHWEKSLPLSYAGVSGGLSLQFPTASD